MTIDDAPLGGPDLPQRRNLVTEIPGPRSRALDARRRRSVSAGVGVALPVFAQAAGGGIIRDVDGNSLIDLASGIAVTSVGNANPRVVNAVQRQAAQFTHTAFGVVPYEGYIEVAERLARLTPGDFEKRSALFNSGAEAVENAVKFARSASGRAGIAVLEHAFHGRTNLTMALTAKANPYKRRFGPFASEIYRVPGSYPLRDGLAGPKAAARTIHAIEKRIGADSLAAIIVEPIQGEGGFIVPAEGFLPALADWARANGVLLVADEIQSGLARTGKLFASEWEGIVPDLVTTAKAIAGGLPLSAVTGRAEVLDAPQTGGIGGTYGGNPVATAAAVAALDEIVDRDLAGRAFHIGETLTTRLDALAEHDARIAEVRGRGAMIAIELVDPATGAPDPVFAERVIGYAHRQGVVVLEAGTDGNVIRFLPPLVIDDALLDDALDVIEAAFAAS